ncbi:MAG: tryptophan--tRNA ligase [Candidatus Paceibacterota bacterium]|jgi:tryptophanyl-tRNA synthetase
MNKKKNILTGMRPTGRLHLGHYVGALENWINLQKEYNCSFLIADYQALGDYAEDIGRIRNSVIEVALDWLSVGLDPQKNNFVIQSYIPEYAELTLLLSMITPKGMIDRNPTLKAEMAIQKDVSLGFYNYPASQVADILLSKADLVPAGEDQLPHIELTREIARKFNRIYGNIFPIPQALIGRIPRLTGIDGKAKMSKSLGNCIYLSDSEEEVIKKVKKMYTDPTRIKATDPGHIEGNVVFMYLEAFYQDKKELDNLKKKYINGGIGDVEIKKILSESLNNFLKPIREKRAFYKSHPQEIKKALIEGTLRAETIAKKTITEVKNAMNISKYEDIENIKKIIASSSK